MSAYVLLMMCSIYLFMYSFNKGLLARRNKLCNVTNMALQQLLKLLGCSMPRMQDPWRCSSGPGSTFAGAAALLQVRLLQTYLLLPSAAAYSPEHATLLRLCAYALKGPSAPSGKPRSLLG